jgi:hypothetical protein
MRVRFLLIGEGTSDLALVGHLERCFILAGAREAGGEAPDLARLLRPPGHGVSEKLRAVLELDPVFDAVLIHRDSDSPDPRDREEEIRAAVAEVAPGLHYVAVVPVQELEAWLLLDEKEIRRVAENPAGRAPLDLPTAAVVESIAKPKERLEEAIVTASELSGRRLDKLKSRLSEKRTLLIRRLDPISAVAQVPAWQRLQADLRLLVAQLADAS